MTADGRLYTVDNGSNANLGGNPAIVKGEATNKIVNGGTASAEPLFLIEQGEYYGHPNPTRSNQNNPTRTTTQADRTPPSRLTVSRSRHASRPR